MVKIENELVKIENELVKMGYELVKMGYELVKVGYELVGKELEKVRVALYPLVRSSLDCRANVEQFNHQCFERNAKICKPHDRG